MMPRQDARHRAWQDEVARDPGSPAFLPLADLYRAQGRFEVARRICVRGLERHPEHVEAHFLFGRILYETRELEAAYDEWDIALRLDPSHVGARRAIALLCQERGDLARAELHLRRALEIDPHDPRLQRALAALRRGPDGAAPDGRYWESAAGLLKAGLQSFVRESRARLILVTDPAGRVVVQEGFSPELDIAAFASLAAGLHAASGEMARRLGERRFDQLYQGQGERQIFLGVLQTPAGELLLLAVFGAETPVGLVRALFVDLGAAIPGLAWPALPSTAAGGSLDEDLAAGVARALPGAGGRLARGAT